jgi:hypothetical protein
MVIHAKHDQAQVRFLHSCFLYNKSYQKGNISLHVNVAIVILMIQPCKHHDRPYQWFLYLSINLKLNHYHAVMILQSLTALL